MGNGRSRTKTKYNNLLPFSSYFRGINTDIANKESVSDSLSKDHDAQMDKLDKDIVDKLRELGVEVDTNSTKSVELPDEPSISRRGFPTDGKSSRFSSPSDMQRERNLSLYYAYNVLNVAKSLGIIDKDSRIILNYTSDFDDSFSGHGRQTSLFLNGRFTSIVELAGRSTFNSFPSTSWSTSSGFTKGTLGITTVHELGHLFDRHVTKKLNLKKLFSDTISGDYSVSTYGQKNTVESFAESFAMYSLGIPSSGRSDYYRNFVKAMNDNGFSSMYGSARNSPISKSMIIEDTSTSVSIGGRSTNAFGRPHTAKIRRRVR